MHNSFFEADARRREIWLGKCPVVFAPSPFTYSSSCAPGPYVDYDDYCPDDWPLPSGVFIDDDGYSDPSTSVSDLSDCVGCLWLVMVLQRMASVPLHFP